MVFRMDAMVAFERFRRLFNWEKFSIIAHSMGGAFAMMYAGVFPERVDKLVMLDIARVPATIPDKVNIKLRKAAEKFLKYEEANINKPEKPMSYEDAVRKGVEGTFGSLNEEACHILYKRGLKKVDGGYVFRRDRRLFAAPFGFFPKQDLLILANKVTADVLLFKFKDGPQFETMDEFMEHVEALKTKSKNVRFVEIEGMHHTHLKNPERVAPFISDFFNSPSA